MLASRRIHSIVDAPRLTKFLLQAPKCVSFFHSLSSSPFPFHYCKLISHCELLTNLRYIVSIALLSLLVFKRIGIAKTMHELKLEAVEVEYANGSMFKLSAEFLRIQSPAADGKIRSIGGEKVISGRRHVGIMSAELVGNYGVRIIFDDLHKTGIYSWDYFYHLGSNKYSLMKSYIKTLRTYGLSRDPPKRK
ncbi:hypothetical protein FNV43_RR14204 [Rhamnella rubrinervis]|uniref:Gamma-butyrobetaine hydroxylase-like N-terminal domain-containing protein n=1 Tax=Rhamnella rubrinervis TaxID=2594499 RepID=A0A8K0H2E7_9ROSA|nr:hypothetical protein FNV43_RR14204 [Rhamnella rubrinervis]